MFMSMFKKWDSSRSYLVSEPTTLPQLLLITVLLLLFFIQKQI